MAHPKHDIVRARWQARCGYCSVAESDAGGELTVDHFVPVVAGGDDSDDNLVYCCFRCNLFKADFYPTPQDRAEERIILHPSRDDLSTHFRVVDATGVLQHLTEFRPDFILHYCI